MTTIQQVVDAARGYASTSGMTNASTKPVWLVDFVLKKKSDASALTVGACSGTPCWNGSGAPAGVQYRAGLIVPTIEQSILARGEPGRSAVVTRGVLQLPNVDGFWEGHVAGQTLDLVNDYEWQTATIRLGVNPDAYSDFNIIDSYRILGRPHVEHPHVYIRAEGALLDDTAPAYDAKYIGLGSWLDSDDGTLHVASGASDTNVALAEDFILGFWFQVPATASAMVLWANRATATGTASGMAVRLTAGGALALSVGDGAAEFVVSTTTVVDDGALHRVEVWADRDAGTLHGELDRVAFTTDGADISAMVAVAPKLAFRTHELTGGGTPTTGAIVDVFWATGTAIAPSADERQARYEGPASIRTTGAQYHWPMEERAGTTTENGYDARAAAAVHAPKATAVTGTASANEEITFGDNHDLDGTTDYTWWKWFRVSTGHQGTIFSKKQDGTTANAGYLVDTVTASTYRFVLSDGVTQAIVSGGTQFTDGVWRCIRATIDRSGRLGTAERAYLHLSDSSGTVWTQLGTATDISSVGSMSNAVALQFRARGDGAADFNGDDASAGFVDGKALTDAEASKHVPRHPSQADIAELASYWPMDEGTGTTITDAVVGTGVDGTIGAGGSWTTRNGTITPGTATNGGWAHSKTGGYAVINNLPGGGGTSKGQGFGLVRRAPVVWIDNVGHDYSAVDSAMSSAIIGQFNVGDYACQEVLVVEEQNKAGGVVATGGSGGSPGDYDYFVDLTNGWIYWNVTTSFPDPTVMVTFKGMKFNGALYSDRLGLCSREWLTANSHLTAGQLPAASATDFDPDFNAPVGIYIPGGKARLRTVKQQLAMDFAAPGLFTGTNLTGATYHFMRSLISKTDLDALTADVTLTDPELASIPREGEPPTPVREVAVGYALDQESGAYEYARYPVTTVTDSDARTVTLPTPLQNHADAYAWAKHVADRLTDPLILEVDINRYFWSVYLARAGRSYPDVVSLQSAYSKAVATAKNFLVYGVRYGAPRASGDWEISLILYRPS